MKAVKVSYQGKLCKIMLDLNTSSLDQLKQACSHRFKLKKEKVLFIFEHTVIET